MEIFNRGAPSKYSRMPSWTLSYKVWTHIKISNIGFLVEDEGLKAIKNWQQRKALSRRQRRTQRNKLLFFFFFPSKSMVEIMDLKSDKGIFCFVLFWFNLCFGRIFNYLWWYICSQIKLYKSLLLLLFFFFFFCSLQYLLLIFIIIIFFSMSIHNQPKKI